MSLDDEYVDRNDTALVDRELKVNSEPVQHGVVAGTAINAGKFVVFLFIGLVISLIAIVVVKAMGIKSSLLDGVIMWGIFYALYKLYRGK